MSQQRSPTSKLDGFNPDDKSTYVVLLKTSGDVLEEYLKKLRNEIELKHRHLLSKQGLLDQKNNSNIKLENKVKILEEKLNHDELVRNENVQKLQDICEMFDKIKFFKDEEENEDKSNKYENKIKELKQKLSSKQSSADQIVQLATENLESLKLELSKQIELKNVTVEKVEAFKCLVNDRNSEVEKLKSEIVEIGKNLKDQNQLDIELQDSNKEKKINEEKKNDLLNEENEWEMKMSELNASKEEKDLSLHDVQEKIRDNTNKTHEIELQISNENKKLIELQQKQVEQLEQVLVDLAKEAEMFTKEIQMTNEKINEISAKNDEVIKQIKESDCQLQTVIQAIETIKKNCQLTEVSKDYSDENKLLENEIDEILKEIETIEKDNEKDSDEMEKLQENLKELGSEKSYQKKNYVYDSSDENSSSSDEVMPTSKTRYSTPLDFNKTFDELKKGKFDVLKRQRKS